MEEQINLYTNKIYNDLMSWKTKLDVIHTYRFSDKVLKSRIKKIVISIFANNNQYILTDDLIHFITFTSYRENPYDIRILQELEKFEKISSDKLANYIRIYFSTILSGNYDATRERELKIEEYMSLMNDETKDIATITKNVVDSLIVYRYQHRFVLDNRDFYVVSNFLFASASHAIITHDKELFNKIIDKFFKNFNYTFQFFRLHGIINHYCGDYNNLLIFMKDELENNDKKIIIK